MMSYNSMRQPSKPWWRSLRITWKALILELDPYERQTQKLSHHKRLTNKRNLEHTFKLISLTPTPHPISIYTTHPIHPPNTHTHYHHQQTSHSVVGLKGKVKVRTIRNKTRYRRLTSIYIEYKGQKINT